MVVESVRSWDELRGLPLEAAWSRDVISMLGDGVSPAKVRSMSRDIATRIVLTMLPLSKPDPGAIVEVENVLNMVLVVLLEAPLHELPRYLSSSIPDVVTIATWRLGHGD